MKANELRIGNWLLGANGKYLQVDPYGISVIADESVDCKPIPLTPEILEKCGFVKWSNTFLFIEMEKNTWVNQYLLIRFKNSEINQVIAHNRRPNMGTLVNSISSLHQLQNIYFALTGTELEIKL